MDQQLQADLYAQDTVIESIEDQAKDAFGEDRAILLVLIASLKHMRELAHVGALVEQMPGGSSLMRSISLDWACTDANGFFLVNRSPNVKEVLEMLVEEGRNG
jgi:hypothetical protein